jgi:hypothetical protein
MLGHKTMLFLVTSSWAMVVRWGKEHFPQLLCRSCDLMSVESLLFHSVVTLQFSSMEREISHVKWAHLLPQNQI